MKCPKCGVLARLRSKSEVGQGIAYRIYRCQQTCCGYRFTSIEQVAGPTMVGGFRGSKLTAEDVAEIRALLKVGMLTHERIAQAYSVSQPLIAQIAAGNRWRGIEPIPLGELRPEQAALLVEERSTKARDQLLARATPARGLLKELVDRGYGLKRMKRALAEAGFLSRNGRPLSNDTIQNWLEVLGLRPLRHKTGHGLDNR